MKWSWKIARVAGIDVYIHATFLLILSWVALGHRSQGFAGMIGGVLFMLAIFACVVLHEFGHALTARRYGIKTRDITLYPIGGVARLERMPDQPLQELWVALAGPVVNLVIAAALFAWLTLTTVLVPFEQLTVTTGPFLERLLVTNLFLAGFNLLPAFPMDGGRVLRALLALRLEYTRATQIAATIGQGMALLFGFAGIFGNPMLTFIALFVWIGAAQEASLVLMKSALAGIPISRAMVTEFRTLAPGDTLDRAVELILQGSQQDFPVLAEDRVIGILTRADLLKALAQQPHTTRVEAIMQREFHTVDASDMLPVLRHARLVGLVTSENLGEFLMIQAALKERATGAPIVTAGSVSTTRSAAPLTMAGKSEMA
jgi:Zn-dependent protease/CBS domain-containing protein